MQKTGVAWKEAKTLSTFSPKRQLSFSTSVLSQQIHASKNICKACAVYLIGSRFPVPRVAVCVADPSVSGPVVDSVGHPRITRMVHQRLVPPSATSSEVIRCLYVWYCLVVVSPSVGCFNCHSKYIYICSILSVVRSDRTRSERRIERRIATTGATGRWPKLRLVHQDTTKSLY